MENKAEELREDTEQLRTETEGLRAELKRARQNQGEGQGQGRAATQQDLTWMVNRMIEMQNNSTLFMENQQRNRGRAGNDFRIDVHDIKYNVAVTKRKSESLLMKFGMNVEQYACEARELLELHLIAAAEECRLRSRDFSNEKKRDAEEDVIVGFFNGLVGRIRSTLRSARDYRNLKALIMRAKAEKQIMRNREPMTSSMSKMLGTRNNSGQRFSLAKPRLNSINSNEQTVKCKRCLRFGHEVQACRATTKLVNGQREPFSSVNSEKTKEPFICYNCKKPGHLARDCPDKTSSSVLYILEDDDCDEEEKN